MSVFFIHEANLQAFLFELDASRVIAQASVANGEPDLEALSRDTAHPLALRRPRAPSSIKSLLFPAKERVAVYPSNDIHSPPAVSGEEPTVVAGLRACDIVAARLLDSIFIQDDYVDPFYSLRRDGLRMVTVDCVEPAASCFCTLVGGKPYAVDGFDVNLSPIDGGYVVEAGSEKGREMLVAGMSLLR